jgi:hypothetical protein
MLADCFLGDATAQKNPRRSGRLVGELSVLIKAHPQVQAEIDRV